VVRFTFNIDVLYESLVFVFEIGQGTGGQGGGGGMMNELERVAEGGAGGGGGGGGMMNDLEKIL